MAADPATGRDRFLENPARAGVASSVFTSIANWSTSGLKDIEWRGEKYLWSKSREFLRFVAAPKKSGEPFELATESRTKDAEALSRPLALLQPAPDERRLLAVSRLHPALERRVHGRERSIREVAHRLVQRPQRLLSRGRAAGHHAGDRVHRSLRQRRGAFAFRSLGEIAAAVREINAD